MSHIPREEPDRREQVVHSRWSGKWLDLGLACRSMEPKSPDRTFPMTWPPQTGEPSIGSHRSLRFRTLRVWDCSKASEQAAATSRGTRARKPRLPIQIQVS